MKNIFLRFVLIALFVTNIQAGLLSQLFDNCFEAKQGSMEIGQQIRKEAESMDWKIGKIKSIAVGGVVKAKQAIYPDGEMEVCLKEKDGDLHFIMKSTSDDAGEPEWHFLKSSKKGFF